jgi:DNA-binding PadR family transcriptional regulator
MKHRLSNPLALAVLALLFERPMHPYEMAATLKNRQKHESIKLRYGSLYTVIDLLMERGFISAKETSRDGKRPERTVYTLSAAGRDELRDWMQELVSEPAKEFPQFEAALCLLPVLSPDEAVKLLGCRAVHLSGKVARLEAQLSHMVGQDLSAIAGPEEKLPAHLAGEKFPPIFIVESEYRLALIKAELDFVRDLVRRITEDGWGPVGLWREIQASMDRQHRSAGSRSCSSSPAEPQQIS